MVRFTIIFSTLYRQIFSPDFCLKKRNYSVVLFKKHPTTTTTTLIFRIWTRHIQKSTWGKICMGTVQIPIHDDELYIYETTDAYL